MTSVDANTSVETSKPLIRIDGAHRIAGSNSAVSAEVPQAVSVASNAESVSEQLQVQADQLARHLQDRRRDVDYREAQLNARIAQLENDLRLSRLWLREQSEEFSQRETELREQLSAYEARTADLALAEEALEESRQVTHDQLQTRDELLSRRELELMESQKRIAMEASRLQAARQQLELERDELERERCDSTFDKAVDEVANMQRAHRRQFEEWQQQRLALEEEAARQKRDFEAKVESWQLQHRRALEEREQQQQLLHRQRDQLEQKSLTVEKTRADVVRLHREALEMRLVTEQMWTQLAGMLAPAELAAGSSKIRNQLADEFRFQTEELELRRNGIQDLLTSLEEKRNQIIEQRRELTAWFGRRQIELAQRASDLSRREQHLQAKLDQSEAQRSQWLCERRQLQLEIQELERRVARIHSSNG